jgi:hypothetical protein
VAPAGSEGACHTGGINKIESLVYFFGKVCMHFEGPFFAYLKMAALCTKETH